MRESRPLRLAALAAVIVAGLLSIVGSGGGLSIGFPPCVPPLCSDTPPLPTVSVEPEVATAVVGGTVVFRAVSTDAGGLPLQWQRSDDGGASWQNIAGATGSTLQVGPVNLADDGLRLRAAIPGTALAQLIPARLAVSATPGIVFEDGGFEPANWQRSELALFNQTIAPQLDERRESGGGNPGAFRRMSARLSSPGGGAAVLYLWQGGFYDPRTQGAIRHLDQREDCIALNPSDVRGTEVNAGFEQAGRGYESTRAGRLCLSGSWSALSGGGLQAGDFRIVAGPPCGAGESCPDFSAAGAPIRLGHVRRNSGPAGDTVQHGIDNWRVTVWRR